MKNKWIYLILTAVCLAVFAGYQWTDRLAKDIKAPEFHMEDSVPLVSVYDSEDVLLRGITARDDRDGDVTDTILVERITLCDDSGLATVVYAAVDRAGNVSKTEREIRYADYQPPRFELGRELVFMENTSFDILSAVSATDLLDGDITHRIRATTLDGNSVSTAGNHTVQFRVHNSLGDTTVLELPVEVHPAGTYQGELVLKDYLAYLKPGDVFDDTDYLVSYTLGPKTVEFNRRLPENVTVEIDNRLDVSTPGVYEVSYTLTYRENNNVYTGYSKLIVIVEG